MRLYRTRREIVLESDHRWLSLPDADWAALTTRADLPDYLKNQARSSPTVEPPSSESLLAPIAMQEVWAAGVTYYRSRTARMEESQTAGGGSFYDRVYHAERPIRLSASLQSNSVLGAPKSS